MEDFLPAGSIARPGPIGRLARIGLGLVTLYGLVLILRASRYLWVEGIPVDPKFALGAVFCVYAIPPVVNIAYGVSWGRTLRKVVIVAICVAGGIGWVLHQDPLGPYAGMTVGVMMVLVLLQLGPSFLLSGVLAVPG